MDARNFDFSDEAPDTYGGWCYDLGSVIGYEQYTVAYSCGDGNKHRDVKREAYRLVESNIWRYKDSTNSWEILSGTVYAFRKVDELPLPEPPPLPSGWEESNG